VSLDATPLKCKPPPSQHLHICTDMTLTFDLWPWKPFQQFPWWIFCAKCHWIPHTKYRYRERTLSIIMAGCIAHAETAIFPLPI